MPALKTKILVKPHYVGTKTLTEAFFPVLKQQVEKTISSQDVGLPLQNDSDCGIIRKSSLLLESEEVC